MAKQKWKPESQNNTKYPRKGIEGIDWDIINEDRRQVRSEEIKLKTIFVKT